MWERIPSDNFLIQETRFRVKSVRMISGKTLEYKLSWIGNEKGLVEVGIFFAEKQVDKVTDLSGISDEMILTKVSKYWFKGLLFQ